MRQHIVNCKDGYLYQETIQISAIRKDVLESKQRTPLFSTRTTLNPALSLSLAHQELGLLFIVAWSVNIFY